MSTESPPYNPTEATFVAQEAQIVGLDHTKLGIDVRNTNLTNSLHAIRLSDEKDGTSTTDYPTEYALRIGAFGLRAEGQEKLHVGREEGSRILGNLTLKSIVDADGLNKLREQGHSIVDGERLPTHTFRESNNRVVTSTNIHSGKKLVGESKKHVALVVKEASIPTKSEATVYENTSIQVDGVPDTRTSRTTTIGKDGRVSVAQRRTKYTPIPASAGHRTEHSTQWTAAAGEVSKNATIARRIAHAALRRSEKAKILGSGTNPKPSEVSKREIGIMRAKVELAKLNAKGIKQSTGRIDASKGYETLYDARDN